MNYHNVSFWRLQDPEKLAGVVYEGSKDIALSGTYVSQKASPLTNLYLEYPMDENIVLL